VLTLKIIADTRSKKKTGQVARSFLGLITES